MDPFDFLDDFRAEAGEHLRALDAQLLKLERDPRDPQPIREMFLSAHTIKGGAAMLGLDDARDLAHAMEDVLACLRDERRPLDRPTADTLFRAVDMLRELAANVVPGQQRPDAARDELIAALHERASARGEPTAAALPEIPPAPAATSTARVLLVDDSATVRMLETMLLNDAGFEVDAVADGNEAFALARTHEYALVVTAVETRSLRGLDLAEALRATPACRDVPIILMSSDENPEHRQRAAAAGVQAYIRKGSFGEQRLVAAARELAGGPPSVPPKFGGEARTGGQA
jgi:chemotaxis protein histidine kinase CheA